MMLACTVSVKLAFCVGSEHTETKVLFFLQSCNQETQNRLSLCSASLLR